MDNRVRQALEAAITSFSRIASTSSESFLRELYRVFEENQDFLEKVEAMDQVFDDQPVFDPLREVVFDLLLINFFNEDAQRLVDDYFETQEWETIEEATLDRGTELLNLLLYINECSDEDIKPELTDFLHEFLLVEEDEFQDEYRIYEDIIAHQILMDSSIAEIGRIAKSLPDSSEIKELFFPMMAFFYETESGAETLREIEKNSPYPDFDVPVYQLITNFYQSN